MTRWISLETAAEILGVTEFEASYLLTYYRIRERHTMNWGRLGPVLYDAQAVEELAKIRKAGKP